MLTTAIENMPFYFRDGILEVINLGEDYKIPLVVVSAGIGNIIQQMLSEITDNDIEIRSNFIEFDSCGKFLGFSTPIVHSQNKFISIRGKKLPKSLIVLGDIPSVIVT